MDFQWEVGWKQLHYLLKISFIACQANRLFFSTVLSPAFLKPRVNKAQDTRTFFTFTAKQETRMKIWKIVWTVNICSISTALQNGFKSTLKYWLLPQVSQGHVYSVTGLLISLGSVLQQIKATETPFSNFLCSVPCLQLFISSATMAPLLLVLDIIHLPNLHRNCCSCLCATWLWPRSW